MAWPPPDRHIIVPRDAVGRPIAPKPKVKRVKREAPVQSLFVQYLDLALDPAEVWWSATLNGVYLTRKQIGEAVEQGRRKGLYDLIFIRLTGPDAGQTYHLEVKAPGGSLTKEQRALMEVLAKAGRGAKAKNLDELYSALKSWGFTLRARP